MVYNNNVASSLRNSYLSQNLTQHVLADMLVIKVGIL